MTDEKAETTLTAIGPPIPPAENPGQLMHRASNVAGVCKDIVTKTALTIQGRKFVRVEGWQAIATAHGCVLSVREVTRTDTGFLAIGECRRMVDGMVLATAEGFVGNDEATWAKRPEYAKRAMASTRAMSRVGRSAFAHVVVLIDAGLSTTPAEEVPDNGFEPEDPGRAPAKRSAPPAAPAAEPPKQGEVFVLEAMLVDWREASSKPGTAKPWQARFCNFEDVDGNTLEIGTFDKKLWEKMDPLKGALCAIRYEAGRRAGTWNLLGLDPADDIPH